MKILFRLFSVLLFLLLSTSAFCELNEFGNTPNFDYAKTRKYIAIDFKNGESRFLGNPFNEYGVGMGSSVYAIYLRYAGSYQPISFPLEQPYYRLVFLGQGQIRNIYVGDHWLQFEDQVAFLSVEHYQWLIAMLEARFNNSSDLGEDFVNEYIAKRLAQDPPAPRDQNVSLKKAIENLRPLLAMKLNEERWANFFPEPVFKEASAEYLSLTSAPKANKNNEANQHTEPGTVELIEAKEAVENIDVDESQVEPLEEASSTTITATDNAKPNTPLAPIHNQSSVNNNQYKPLEAGTRFTPQASYKTESNDTVPAKFNYPLWGLVAAVLVGLFWFSKRSINQS